MNAAHEVLQERMLGYSWKAFAESPAGRDFLEQLSKLEHSALNAIVDCADYRESTELVIRYQQRRAVAEWLRNHMQSQISLLGGEEPNEHDTDDASYSGSTGTDSAE